jgi:cell division septum initiation protein DivIVA
MDLTYIVEELQSLVSTGSRVPGFRRKVLVEIDRLEALAEKVSMSAPAHMQEANEVLKQKESMINQAYLEAQRIKGSAEQEADAITTAARREHETKVSDSEITEAAEAKAREIKDEATVEAQQLVQDAQRRAHRIMSEAEVSVGDRRDGADQYTREVLFNLEERLADVLGQVRRGLDSLVLESEKPQRTGNHVPV